MANNTTIKLNPSFKDAHSTDKRYRVLYGGAGSGKSYYVEQETIINMLESSDYHYLAVRKTGKSIRQSLFRGIATKIAEYGLINLFDINKTEMSITSKTGSTLITSGLDDVEKLKSVSEINRIWIEEASEVTQEDFEQLDLRMRGQSNIGYQMTLTFNPVNELHWLKRYFFDLQQPDAFTLKTTYLDNPFIDDEYKRTLNNMKKTNEQYYRIYALGEWGSTGGLIYTNWEQQDLSDIKDSFDNIFNGLDFGFSDDPTAFVRVHYDKTRKIIYIFDEFAKRELFTDKLAEILLKRVGRKRITSDVMPNMVAELKRYGVNIEQAKKGPDSVQHGITWIKGHKIIVDQSCTETIKELSSYRWKEDRQGNITDRPLSVDDHLLDAVRYALESEMTGTNRGIRTLSKSSLGL